MTGVQTCALPICDIYTPEERAFCHALKDGPLILQEAAKAVGKDIYSFSFDRIEKEGVVIRCGLTPTDIMHIRGDFSDFDREAALMGARQLIYSLDKKMSVEQFCEAAYTEVKRKMYTGIVKCLMQYNYPTFRRHGFNEQMDMLINESFREALAKERGEGSRFLDSLFRMPSALVGIGAPIAIFLPDVAKLLGTKAVITDHYEVANAVGAVIGNVMATVTGQIVPQPAGGYRLFLKTGYKQFDTLEEATEEALVKLRELAREEAIARGAIGEMSFTEEISGQDKETAKPFIDSTIAVTAIARIRAY